MKRHVIRQIRFVRSTLIGGVIFLLPLMVIGFLVSQAWPVFDTVVKTLAAYFGDDYWAYGMVFVAAVAILLGLCLVAGLLARMSLSRMVSEQFEKQLTMLFPRYAIFKDQLAGNLGGTYARDRLKPVLIPYLTGQRIGFEIERDASRVIVYLPGSPDPWTGEFVIFAPDDITHFHAPTAELLSVFEKLGRDALELVPAHPAVDG